jgi:hypothetical protein
MRPAWTEGRSGTGSPQGQPGTDEAAALAVQFHGGEGALVFVFVLRHGDSVVHGCGRYVKAHSLARPLQAANESFLLCIEGADKSRHAYQPQPIQCQAIYIML